MKVTTSAWGKREEASPKRSSNEETLNIIYDSSNVNLQNVTQFNLDDDVTRTSSPEHLGIPAGPIRMPIKRKPSIQNGNSSGNSMSRAPNDEFIDDPPQKPDRSVKKPGGKMCILKESINANNIYTSDESCVDSAPPSRVRHPPPNRRKVIKSSVNSNNMARADSDEVLDRQ